MLSTGRPAYCTGDPQGIPTGTPDHFSAQAEGLGGPCGTRGTPTLQYMGLEISGGPP